MSDKKIAIVDCNNFYVSCERLFNPKLKNKPTVVLSNNDGCIIARSQEIKDMGVKMGQPVFKLEDDEGLVFQDEGISYPMNSGMISLVFRAKRRIDNSNVIVKLKRKNIEYKLKEAIDNLLFFIS